jgi:hypothetical protein
MTRGYAEIAATPRDGTPSALPTRDVFAEVLSHMASAESHVGAPHVNDHTPQFSWLDGALLKAAAAVIAGSITATLV